MPKKEFQNETFAKTITYRGISVDIWFDDYGQQLFAKFVDDPLFGTQDIGFGSYNSDIDDDLQYIIDDKLDTIYRFDKPYYGAHLKWFDNGGIRDIKLTYRSRVLKIFLTPANYELTEIEKNKIIEISTSILQRLVKPEDGKFDLTYDQVI